MNSKTAARTKREWGQVFHVARFQKFDGLKPGAEGSASGSPWAGAGVRCPGERVANGREIEETAEPDPCDR
jgi:hypothetical protein